MHVLGTSQLTADYGLVLRVRLKIGDGRYCAGGTKLHWSRTSGTATWRNCWHMPLTLCIYVEYLDRQVLQQ